MQKLFIGLMVAAAFFLYLQLALAHSNTVNFNGNDPDQMSYMKEAIRVKTSTYRYLGDRNRMPVYSYLQSIFYEAGMPYEIYFEQGKIFNIFLSMFLLLLIYKVASNYFDGLALIAYSLTVAFTLFLLKSPYFQVEILFYTFYFITFLSFIQLLQHQTIKLGFISGALGAITYLTKATMFMGFSLFMVFFLLVIFTNLIRRKSDLFKHGLFSLLTCLSVFFVITSPYLLENKRLYGKYFFNENTTYFLWSDSNHEALGKYNSSRIATEKPSLSLYLKTHSMEQIINRFRIGFLRVAVFLIWTYAAVPISFLLLYFLFFVFTAYLSKYKLREFIKKYFLVLAFTFFYFIAHLAAFSWYGYLDSGPRFILTLYLPALFLITKALEKLRRRGSFNYQNMYYWLTGVILILGLKFSIIPILQNIYTGF